MKREYPEAPILGVGGIVFKGDRVLLAKRGQDPGKGLWTLPGGVVELGETLEEALMREIKEEISIDIRLGGFVRLLDRIVTDHQGRVRFHYVIADYWGTWVSGEVQPASDSSDARFVSLEEMPTMGLHKEVVDTILLSVQLRYREGKAKESPWTPGS